MLSEANKSNEESEIAHTNRSSNSPENTIVESSLDGNVNLVDIEENNENERNFNMSSERPKKGSFQVKVDRRCEEIAMNFIILIEVKRYI